MIQILTIVLCGLIVMVGVIIAHLNALKVAKQTCAMSIFLTAMAVYEGVITEWYVALPMVGFTLWLILHLDDSLPAPEPAPEHRRCS